MTSLAIELLLDECAFDPRTLQIKFPKQALAACELPAQAFFGALKDAPQLSSMSFLDGRWRADTLSQELFETAGPEGRVEINAIICGVLHEISHRVDLLITPFGVQYLVGAIEEYLLLQTFVPQALDREESLPALSLLRCLSGGLPPEAAKEPRLAQLWPRLRGILRRTLAWGDLGKSRPPESEIILGWFGEDRRLDGLKLAGEDIELITVCGSVRTFRPRGKKGWYVRPMTILEAKALANTMLHALDLSGNKVDEVRLFFDACYGSRLEDLEPDYLYIFDVVARTMGPASFQEALAKARPEQLGTLLRLVTGVCWFALHAPPVASGTTLSGAGASVTMRLFAALHELEPLLDVRPQFKSVSELCGQLEQTAMFKGMEQLPIAEALAESCLELDALGSMVDAIWNPDVRAWFQRLIGIMRPYLVRREARYDSLLGMPDDGNIFTGVHRQDEWEALYDDHLPQGAAAEWLALRRTLLFSYEVPKRSSDYVRKLDAHFAAKLVVFPCDFCRGFHDQWVSRFSGRIRLVCPKTGKSNEVLNEEVPDNEM